jgi:hypothetical protein
MTCGPSPTPSQSPIFKDATCPATPTCEDSSNEWNLYLQIGLATLLIISELMGISSCQPGGLIDGLVKLLKALRKDPVQ